ncbi:hypothetical protein J8L86_20935 [Shewanella sp. MMG014]|uniref:BsuPI-related putative proteinase inhibitor n=1 Tax=Shewanella sp. MMG014 TaxID=2822691 RepID=UPI001B381F13|nr:BsuPI-related putative proteinase inhibitor [Shewanella sp. MMG014]MBQ4892318.1 hypothetical protein [Shewanella sp. MMG014]
MKRLVGCLGIFLVGCTATNMDSENSYNEEKVASQEEKIGKTIVLGMEKSAKAHTLLVGQFEAEPYSDRKKPMLVTYTATNTQSEPVSIRFNSSMTADLLLMDQQGEKLWSSSQDMVYMQALREVTLAPGEAIVSRFSVPAIVMNKVNDSGYWFGVKFVGQAMNGNNAMLLNASSIPLVVK